MTSEQFVLTGEMVEGVDGALRKFIGNSHARCALLLTHSGQLVGQVGFTAHLNVLSLCALVAGIFTTTQELARVIGESKFKSLFQEGKSWNLHFTLVSEDLIFATLFDKKTVIGAVQVAASEATEEIAKLLEEFTGKPSLEPDHELEAMKRELAHLETLTGQPSLRAPVAVLPPSPAAPVAPVMAPPSAPAVEKKEEKKEEKPPQNFLSPDFEESAAAALDKLFEI
jgi:predicted regulator of Ras-like GTPase activity (Roadblock/LC7/MglB family)